LFRLVPLLIIVFVNVLAFLLGLWAEKKIRQGGNGW